MPRAKTWRELPARDRQRALNIICNERAMWRSGKDTQWNPASLPEVKRNYRALGAAIAELRAAAKGRRR